MIQTRDGTDQNFRSNLSMKCISLSIRIELKEMQINIDKETVEEDRNKVKIQKSTPSSECKK